MERISTVWRNPEVWDTRITRIRGRTGGFEIILFLTWYTKILTLPLTIFYITLLDLTSLAECTAVANRVGLSSPENRRIGRLFRHFKRPVLTFSWQETSGAKSEIVWCHHCTAKPLMEVWCLVRYLSLVTNPILTSDYNGKDNVLHIYQKTEIREFPCKCITFLK